MRLPREAPVSHTVDQKDPMTWDWRDSSVTKVLRQHEGPSPISKTHIKKPVMVAPVIPDQRKQRQVAPRAR